MPREPHFLKNLFLIKIMANNACYELSFNNNNSYLGAFDTANYSLYLWVYFKIQLSLQLFPTGFFQRYSLGGLLNSWNALGAQPPVNAKILEI